jgi:hypothetical protein
MLNKYTSKQIKKIADEYREKAKDLLNKKFLSLQNIHDTENLRDKDVDNLIDLLIFAAVYEVGYLQVLAIEDDKKEIYKEAKVENNNPR